MLMKALKDSRKLFIPVMKSDLVLLSLLFLGCEIMQHYFLILIQVTKETQSFNLFAIIGQITTSLFEFVALTMLVPLRVMGREHPNLLLSDNETFISFTQRHVTSLTAESIRSLAAVIIWSLLFIIPGIFKYIRYSFVPYVVVADPEYQKGTRDALEYSNELVKGYTFQIFILFAILLAQEAARSWAREHYPIMHQPLSALLAGGFFFMLNIFANILLFRLYQLRVNAKSLIA